MRVLGIEIAGSDIRWGILKGDNKSGIIESIDPPKLTFPVSGADEADNLVTLLGQVRTILTTMKPDRVGIIRAVSGTSVKRAKVECVVELACKEAKVGCTLLSPNTIAAAKKTGVAKVTGVSFEQAFGTPQFSYLSQALYCAWSVLNGS